MHPVATLEIESLLWRAHCCVIDLLMLSCDTPGNVAWLPMLTHADTCVQCLFGITFSRPQSPLNFCKVIVDGAVVQVYDIGAFSVLGLNSSLLVPPLLISFYVVLGSLQILADKALILKPSTQEALSKLSPQYLLVNTWYAPPVIQLPMHRSCNG